MAEVGFDGTEENGVSSVAEKGGQLSPELKKRLIELALNSEKNGKENTRIVSPTRELLIRFSWTW